MNEKTKRILTYVACTLGGVALGVALLGGLSYCSVSEKAEQTEVNTILTKRNAKETSASGLYDKYTFSVNLNWRDYNSTAQAYVYNVDLSTYTLTLDDSIGRLVYNSFMTPSYPLKDVVGLAVNSATPTDEGAMNFLVLTGTAPSGGHVLYMSFVKTTTPDLTPLPFIGFNLGNFIQGNVSNANGVTYTAGEAKYILNTQISDVYLVRSGGELPTTASFQDVRSYYADLGYNTGYSNGSSEGYLDGYADGFDDGSDNGLLFTDLGVNQLTWASADLSWDDSTDTTQTMKLFDFKDGENSSYYVTLTDYSLGGGNASVQVFKNSTASNNLYATIASGTWNGAYTQLEVIPSNYLKFEFAQITTYYHNSIPNGWFTLSGIPANATGYEVGYQTGYREGYLASPGGQATENVFSLFTNAFDSVGGIFNLKIFGFLPLYWFFLTPIFIAIIALILRLVKH